MAQSSTCPKCGGSMIEGFTVDQTHGSNAVPTWVAGTPERSVWTGVKLSGKSRLEIATWRCRSCGFLEHYAGAGPSPHVEAQQRAQKVALVMAIVIALIAALVAGVAILMTA